MNVLSAKIKLRVDALNNWKNAFSKPLGLGEVGIAYESVNTGTEENPVFEKKNFRMRIGRELTGTHWNNSAELQSEDMTPELYQQLSSQFWLRSEQQDFDQTLRQQFGSEIDDIKNRLVTLESHCKDPAVSAQVLYWEDIIVQP